MSKWGTDPVQRNYIRNVLKALKKETRLSRKEVEWKLKKLYHPTSSILIKGFL